MGLEVESEGKLNRSGLVALRVDRPERGRAPVRVWIAEQRPVEQITEIHLEAELLLVPELELLEDVDVLAVVGETPHCSVDPRRVAELERSRDPSRRSG